MTDIFEPRFLLASLHIEAILRGTTAARRRKTLKSINDGAGLGNAYGATLERIEAQDDEKARLAMATLTWICHSERPLQVVELCHALAVEIGEADFDPENVPSIGILLDCCQGLMEVDAEASTVRLIHYTVQEYLCSRPGFFIRPNSVLAETCLTYLNSQQVNNLTSRSIPDYKSMPFLKYSSRYWGTHTSMDLSENARALALKLLSQYEHHISAVSLLEQVLNSRYIGFITTSPLFSGLHCASFFGIVELVTLLINAGGYEVDQQDCVCKTPLAWAAENGHERVAKALLGRKDVDPNRPDVYDRTPLVWAAAMGHEGLVKILLELENIDPNRPDKDREGPLGWAAIYGYEGVVKLLLERDDIDPNRPDNNDRTPLGCAAFEGHEGVVKLLLGRENVDPNGPDINGRTPLENATIKGHEGVVKLLLERGNLNPNRPNEGGRAPLTNAPIRGQEVVTRSSLEQNVDLNRPDDYHRTPLTNAAINGQEEVATLSPEPEDSDPNHPDSDDRISIETPNVPARVEARWDRLKKRVSFFRKRRT